jgi:hypothetical protein
VVVGVDIWAIPQWPGRELFLHHTLSCYTCPASAE